MLTIINLNKMDEKSIKKAFKEEAQKEPDKFYPVKALKEFGFSQYRCKQTGIYFWSTEKRDVCGDGSVAGGFKFIGKSPAKKKLDYIETWQQFAKIHRKLGYTPIDRYPVVARWNPTTDFTIASIAAFQPFVVSGEVAPPANPLVIPQFCLRFNDIDNVGITGAHYVGFVMLGQHAFVAPKDYDINKYFSDHLYWLNHGMGLENKDITIHQDAWAGGGNLGPSVEFFSAGLELSNQVYMQYELTNDAKKTYKDLNIKVLDMGQGHERVPWFTQGESTSYETTFPSVIKKLRSITSTSINKELMKRFLPYAAWLNVDEVEDMNKAWQKVSEKVGVNVKELKQEIEQQAAMYSVAEHSRVLLFALNDGALPSNIGGGYNLRVILRRALDLAAKYNWNISFPELTKLHAQYLSPIFPKLSGHLDDVQKILEVEKSKYDASRQKARSIISKIIHQKITSDTLLQLYDSQGIAPELIKEESEKANVSIKIPDNFYALVAQLHSKQKQVHETKREEKLDLNNLPETKALYFDDWKPQKFNAKVLKIINNFVVLDQTWFYPTSGGQLHDTGTLNNIKVIDVFKQNSFIIHKLEKTPSFKEGDIITGLIDLERRRQLAQHHTSTHIINAAARKVLGSHVNQAGAKKTLEKASIDITHYAPLSEEDIEKIELEANKLVKKSVPVNKMFIARDKAEKKYGVSIYQGGVAPGKILRIVEIPGIDVEACGGTHLNNTSEAEAIHIIGTSKIADDIVRIEYTAGDAARRFELGITEKIKQISQLIQEKLGLKTDLNLKELRASAEIFSVPVDQLKDTLLKFINIIENNNKELSRLDKDYKQVKFSGRLSDISSQIFNTWKKQKHMLSSLREKIAEEKVRALKEKSVARLNLDEATMREVAMKFKEIFLVNNDGMFVFRGSQDKFRHLQKLGTKGGGKELMQGKVEDRKRILKEFKF